MKIVIPTFMREDSQVSFKGIPASYRDNVVLCTDTSRYEYLKALNPTAMVVDIGITDGIADTRQKLVELYQGEKIFIVDDQVKFYERTPAGRIIPITPEGFERMIEQVETALDSYAWVGISDRAGNNRVSDISAEIQRSYSCYGINTKMWSENDITFDGLYKKTGAKLFEDFYALLSMLTKGMKNLVFYNFAFHHPHGKSGGNAEYRTNKTQAFCYTKLQEEFPEYVKLRWKKNPTWTTDKSDDKRLESIISWRKAYESSQ